MKLKHKNSQLIRFCFIESMNENSQCANCMASTPSIHCECQIVLAHASNKKSKIYDKFSNAKHVSTTYRNVMHNPQSSFSIGSL